MKKILSLFVLLVGFVLFSGCTPTTAVTISVEDKNIEVDLGDVYIVNTQINGLNIAPELAFSSSDSSIFAVDGHGVIEPKSAGIAYLYVSLLNATASKLKITVTITDPANLGDGPGVEGPGNDDVDKKYTLIIANGNLNIEVDDIVYLDLLADGDEWLGATTWISSNQGVASVDSNGTLTALAAGTALISAVTDHNFTSINVSVRDKQAADVLPTVVTITGSNFVNENSNSKLSADPDVAVDSGMIWESSNESIATVDSEGVVTGHAPGVVIITATLENYSNVFGTHTILVKEESTSASPITSITLNGANEVLQGNKIKIDYTYTPATEIATFTYSSSNESVATVDQNGWVRGLSGGTVLITASLVGDASKTATFSVRVIPLPSEILLTGSSTVSIGQSVVIKATVSPTGASTAVTWSTSNSSIASVDSLGNVTGIKGGTAIITATSVSSNTIKETFTITVTDQKSITLSPTSISLIAGSAQTISATVFAASLSDKSVIWSSGNTSVATVDQNGKVTALSAGSATIIAKLNADNTIQAQATVNVTAAPKPTIKISVATANLMVGASSSLTATVSNSTNTSVTWTSSNAAVATVVNGTVTAKAAGTAIITATASADASVKATCAVTVTAVPAGTLTITQSPAGTVAIGNAAGAQLYVDNSAGSVSRLECTFSSSNSSVATVSTYGTIVALANGTAKITVTHPSKGSGTITITIGTGGGVTPPVGGALVVTAEPGASIAVGASGYQIYIRDSSGTSVSRTECTFTSSASGVATVSAYGTVSALTAGSAKITVTHPSKGTGTITLTVTGGGGTVTPGSHGAVFTWLEKYIVSTTFSRQVRTYGNTTKTENTLGSFCYYHPYNYSVNTQYYGRYHEAMPTVGGKKVHYVAIHQTGNNNVGAGAKMHGSYLSTSAVSIHYAIDAGSIYSVNKESSVAWHAGDGRRIAGSTYWNSTYGATCITGGNLNSIGIEMCCNQGNDLFMTWNRTAKITADILKRYNLGTTAVKQHNDFMGKDCPQELRQAGLWTTVFANMIKAEYQYKNLYSGYAISFTSSNPSIINNYGHVIKRPSSNTVVKMTVKISKGGVTATKTYNVTVPSALGAAVTGQKNKGTIS